MAPEVFYGKAHDPQRADVWSLAIIYCSMILCRFPWKAANLSDENFKLFAAIQGPETQEKSKAQKLFARPSPCHKLQKTMSEVYELKVVNTDTTFTNDANTNGVEEKNLTEIVLGPWRLLRHIPDEGRKAVGGMLRINTESRLTLPQVMEDPWVKTRDARSQENSGTVRCCDGHEHVLQSI